MSYIMPPMPPMSGIGGAAGSSFGASVTIASVIIFGWLLIVGGAMQAVHAFWRKRWGGFFVDLLTGILYVVAGFNHLLNPELYVAIIPPGLPNPEWLNVISGLAEIVLGVFLLEPRVRFLAAWGIIALLIAIFPANVYVALENVGLPGGEPGTGNAVGWFQ